MKRVISRRWGQVKLSAYGVKSDFLMTLKNGFGKCTLFVLSAKGWQDRNMDSSFSRQRKPLNEEGIVRLSIGQSCCSMTSKRIIDWFLESLQAWSFFTRAFALKATRVCIRSINQSNRSISVRLLFRFRLLVFISRSYGNRSKTLDGIQIVYQCVS